MKKFHSFKLKIISYSKITSTKGSVEKGNSVDSVEVRHLKLKTFI